MSGSGATGLNYLQQFIIPLVAFQLSFDGNFSFLYFNGFFGLINKAHAKILNIDNNTNHITMLFIYAFFIF